MEYTNYSRFNLVQTWYANILFCFVGYISVESIMGKFK